MKKEKQLYVHTFGCQMNVYDTERIRKALAPLGFIFADSPENADMIVLNTCAIREKPQHKVYSFLGRMLEYKKRKESNKDEPGSKCILAVGGCVAQQEGTRITEHMPEVDLVFGTDAIDRLPAHVESILSGRGHIVDVEMQGSIHKKPPAETRAEITGETKPVSAFVTIMQGCDNFCTYCVVPYVRGRERSRCAEDILTEIRELAARGIKEITLLGQNVNSYGKKEGFPGFASLLEMTAEISGISRIRFTTSHPKDLSDDLVHAFARIPKLCSHFHLPVQSGSNAVLKRMRRKYTREQYLEKVEALRAVRPDIALTTDIIVGFPGETEKDFEQTLDLLHRVKYDSLYAFRYSDRPNAKAKYLPDKISSRKQKERLTHLLDIQKTLTLNKNKAEEGKTRVVLAEGMSSRSIRSATVFPKEENILQYTGRTDTNKIVNFPWKKKEGPVIGEFIRVKIVKGYANSLLGEPVSSQKDAKYTKTSERRDALCCTV